MVEVNPKIAELKEGSVVYTLYKKILSGMEQASSVSVPNFTSPEFVTINEDGTWSADENRIQRAVSEYTTVTRKNAAYMLANAVGESLVDSSSNNGSGHSGGGVLDGMVKREGDSFTGHLNALYGFAAGEGNQAIFSVKQKTNSQNKLDNIAEVNGKLLVPSDGLYIGGANIISGNASTATISAKNIQMKGNVSFVGGLSFGSLSVTDKGIKFGEYDYYHSGNSNIPSVDWTMKDANVKASLNVSGNSVFSGSISALQGFTLGNAGSVVISSNGSDVLLSGKLNINGGEVQVNSKPIIKDLNNGIIEFSAPSSVMNLGANKTSKICLQSDLYDDDGEYRLVSKFGSANFPESFVAGYNYGAALIETYKENDGRAGILVSGRVAFSNKNGYQLYSKDNRLLLEGSYEYQENGDVSQIKSKKSGFSYVPASNYVAQSKKEQTAFFITTDSDLVSIEKPTFIGGYIQITNSTTQLSKDSLKFQDGVTIGLSGDGMLHSGNVRFSDSIGSKTFTSGFSGEGWKIQKQTTTGYMRATFDELIVRKKVRAYETEIHKVTATNGSLWISSSFSASKVEEIV